MGTTKEVFQISEEQYSELEALIAEKGLSGEHKDLIEKFVKKYIMPCYYINITEDEPSPLDSSIGGFPYLPAGDALPNGKELLIQINLEGVELEGYPGKGIFQIFSNYDKDSEDEEDDDDEDDDDWDYGDGFSSIARYYAEISDDYQKNVPCSKNTLPNGHRKIKLEKSWSLISPLYSSFADEIFGDCEIYKKIREDKSKGKIWEIVDEIFCKDRHRSNLGGYASSPQLQYGIPYGAKMNEDPVMLHLDADLIYWGDGGIFYFYYEKIDTLEKDAGLSCHGDMC